MNRGSEMYALKTFTDELELATEKFEIE